jgi:A/G-specific adenine glycosylase
MAGGCARYPAAMPASPSPIPASRRRRLRRLRLAILGWYRAEHRDFPWRATRDPWAVLVSEVMLQQTQASRVAERFPPFLRLFPTPRAMARATDRDVLAAWSGLGYNRRALSLRRTALAVEAAGWPSDVAGLERLPGIGPYTARAVAALAFGQPVGAVDTNVRRWLVRRLGMGSGSGPELQAAADALAATAAGPDDAAAWMHASMEFGGRVCRARDPRCDDCPVAPGCPSRGRAVHVPVARQAPFHGSTRAARGAVLRALSSAPGHALSGLRLAALVPRSELDDVLAALAREGMAHRSGDVVRLGPPEEEAAAVTIGP